MNTRSISLSATATLAGVAAGASRARTGPAEAHQPTDQLLSGLRNSDENISRDAVESAGQSGPEAVEPLVGVMAEPDFEIARRARRALYKLVRHAGTPQAGSAAAGVQAALLHSLAQEALPVQVRRDLLWMLSEIANAAAVPAIARFLSNKELREDTRCVLTRLPFTEAVEALASAMKTSEEDFRYALADALRARGKTVGGYPSRKMLPTEQTTVVPLQKK